jgi:hypothetical protein
MSKKNKIVHLPKLHNAMGAPYNAYIKAILGQSPKKYPSDFVETLIDERKKQLMKKNVQKK